MPKPQGVKTLPTISAISRREELATGTLLGQGRFEIVRLLGQGGMGMVYLARDREIHGEPVALKIMAPELISQGKAVLVREVQTARRLSHPNILRIFDFYQEEETPFFTMEYIAGPSLRQWMSEERRIALPAIHRVLSQIAEGLGYAHQFMVHRDLKPENVLLLPTGANWQAKIADFGLAKLKVPDGQGVSAPAGTTPYIAPELYQKGAEIDGRADIYSIGIILYELLTGKLPLGYFKPPSEFWTDLPPGVDRLTLTCLSQDPKDRFPGAAEFSRALSCLLSGRAKSIAPQREEWQIPLRRFVAEHHGAWNYAAYRALLKSMAEKFPRLDEIEIAVYLERQKVLYAKAAIASERRQWRSWRLRLQTNLQRLMASGLMAEFVIENRGNWRGEEWRQFRERLAREGFSPVAESALLAAVAEERRRYYLRREYLITQVARLKALEKNGEYQEALDILQALDRRGIPESVLGPVRARLAQKVTKYGEWTNAAEKSLAEGKYAAALAAYREMCRLKSSGDEVERKMSLCRREIEEKRRRAIQTLRHALTLSAQKRYDDALSTLVGVEWKGDWPTRVRDALRERAEASLRAEAAVLAAWSRVKSLAELDGKWEGEFPAHTKIPAADFSAGVPSDLARAYQREYAARHHLEVEMAIVLPDDVPLAVRLIPPGIFRMGSPPGVRVIIPAPFYLAVYPVTQEQWEAVCGEAARVDKGPAHPVERVTWEECRQFAQNISAITGASCSLPTEAQWEYACRAGSAADCGDDISEVAWHAANSGMRPHPVGRKKSNAWGIFDMRGQVWEWCEETSWDGHRRNEKVLRGGNACAPAEQCAPHSRIYAMPHCCRRLNGFRIAITN